jgi:hypothetical protein
MWLEKASVCMLLAVLGLMSELAVGQLSEAAGEMHLKWARWSIMANQRLFSP